MNIQSINPATGEVLETFEEMSASEIDRILEANYTTFSEWRNCPFADRAKKMREAARILRVGKEKYARTMALEMGKPIVQGEAEVAKCARACDYYAENAEAFLADQPRETDATRSYIRFDPLGPVAGDHALEFSLLAGFSIRRAGAHGGERRDIEARFERPALRARDRGSFPRGGIPRKSLPRPHRRLAKGRRHHCRSAHSRGDLDGQRQRREQSRRAGRPRDQENRARAWGGEHPFIVLDDADVQKAAKTAADARLINSGQSCIAAKRFIVVEKSADAFLEIFVAEMKTRKMGDPLDRQTQVGPQARDDLRDGLHRQVAESVTRGAKLLLGGGMPEGPGAFYPPTVLAAVQKGMPAFDEETFGPVAAVIRARDEADAIRQANDSPFGLGASLWTQDYERAARLAREIEAGCVFVNELVKSDPRLPFGGVKRSGYGRELSEYSIREFMNIKSVWMA